MLGAEFGPQPPHVHINSPGAPEEVIPPYFVQQLRPSEHPAGMLRQVFQQLELFVGEIQRAATQPGGVGAFVDHQLAQAHLAQTLLVSQISAPANHQPQSGVDLSGPGAEQQDLVQPPVSADRHQPAFAHHRQYRDRPAGRAQQAAQASPGRQVVARVDEHSVCVSRLQQRRRLGRRRPHGVGQQRQRRQDRIRIQLRGQQ
ncbi:Uncharacterised protein [Mycobacterium tuberculosis]|nr:Uncharacterised protein [Mycobacterium tuberculosis]CKS08593.1 Uncharacterised protein [Mycobacterium tuberculosis]CKU56276.1 Uncharacterised protein [Mycobacterium tuberculosis]CNU79733.1 Uncharacterised protein [Mycobacterium tuberculosis]CNV30662.1 Uncharacterised protein [Mycobacterium tuberculosis]